MPSKHTGCYKPRSRVMMLCLSDPRCTLRLYSCNQYHHGNPFLKQISVELTLSAHDADGLQVLGEGRASGGQLREEGGQGESQEEGGGPHGGRRRWNLTRNTCPADQSPPTCRETRARTRQCTGQRNLSVCVYRGIKILFPTSPNIKIHLNMYILYIHTLRHTKQGKPLEPIF